MKGEPLTKLAAIISVVIAFLALQAQGRPRYIDCTDSAECGRNFCCTLGRGRFSLPKCSSLGEIHAPCLPNGQHIANVTVGYPDGEMVHLTNIHSLMCPCMPGLFCSTETGTCQDILDGFAINAID